MSTQGLVSIVDGDEVLMKIIAGCDGYNALELTMLIEDFAFENDRCPTIAEAHVLADIAGFGCDKCRGIMTDKYIDWLADDYINIEVMQRYIDTFNDPRFNPRWAEGSVPYGFVVDLSEEIEL